MLALTVTELRLVLFSVPENAFSLQSIKPIRLHETEGWVVELLVTSRYHIEQLLKISSKANIPLPSVQISKAAVQTWNKD